MWETAEDLALEAHSLLPLGQIPALLRIHGDLIAAVRAVPRWNFTLRVCLENLDHTSEQGHHCAATGEQMLAVIHALADRLDNDPRIRMMAVNGRRSWYEFGWAWTDWDDIEFPLTHDIALADLSVELRTLAMLMQGRIALLTRLKRPRNVIGTGGDTCTTAAS